MLFPKSRHLTRLPGRSLAAAFLGVALLCTGCHRSAGPDGGASPAALAVTPDTPTNLPTTPALFAAAAAPPTAEPVEHAPLPPRPPDPDQVARQALAPAVAPHGTAAAGLIVCDPLPASPSLAAFGDGCGRWLDLVTAGQPELGRTPLWEARARAQQEMGRKDLHLTPTQAAALAGITGATHAAFGTIGGTPAHCSLTYRLYDLRGRRPVGPSVTQYGSEAEVLTALPAVARALDAQLGVLVPRIPASVALSPAELTEVEAISAESHIPDPDLVTLAHLSARSPLAGMYYLTSRASYDQVLLGGMVKSLLARLPGNALVLGHIGYAEPAALRPYAAQTAALIAHFPTSALFAHTQVWEQREWGTRAGEYAAALRATADAPGDPETWLSLGATIGNVAEDLRQGRFAGDMSPAEWASLNLLYPRWEGAMLRATALDPRDGHAWLKLTEAATFVGDGAHATDAFRRALVLDRDKEEVYWEGLQFYQPKWSDDPAALGRIAALATAQTWNSASDAAEIADDLTSAGQAVQSAQVLSNCIVTQRAVVAKYPTDALAHWNLAEALAAQAAIPSLREASLEYRVAEHLMPRSPAIHAGLAGVLDRRNRTTEAIAEYRQAVALDPFDAGDHASLGRDLKHAGLFPAALTELRRSMRLDPHNADAHSSLGDLLYMQHQYRPAVAEYREAIRMDFYSMDAWLALPGALDQCGQYDASLRAGRETDHLLAEQEQMNAETEPPLHDTMADDCLHKKAWAKSLIESQVSLKYNTNDACAHENLAEAYIGQGRKADAHAEWQRAIALGDPVITPVARKLLAAHP